MLRRLTVICDHATNMTLRKFGHLGRAMSLRTVYAVLHCQETYNFCVLQLPKKLEQIVLRTQEKGEGPA